MIFLLVTSVIFVFEALLSFANIIAYFFSRWKTKNSHKYPVMREDLKTLREEQRKLNPQESFAKYSKLQRKINKLQDEITCITKERTYLQAKIKYGLKFSVYVIYVLCSFLIILRYRTVACATLPTNWFSPLGRLLSFPLNEPGSISVPVWLGICRIVSKKLISNKS